MSRSPFVCVSMPLLCCLLLTAVRADNWPQFLGNSRNGVSSEKMLAGTWPTAGPKIVWKTRLGTGMSGLAIHDDLVVTLDQDERDQYAVALKKADGSEQWRSSIGPAYENAMGNGPRATPAISGDSVFVYSGEGILACLTRENGKLLWSVNVPELLKGEPSEYGMSCSPLVVENLVIVHAGTATAAVAAFDCKSGKLQWKAGQGAAGYSSPVLMTFADQPQLVSLIGAQLLGIEPASGKLLWTYPFATDFDCNTACPIQLDKTSLLISAGENHGTAILTMDPKTGTPDPSAVWTSLGRDSQLRAEWQTPVVIGEYLYGMDNVGNAGPITNLVCLRLSDRKTMWRKDRFGKGNLIAADNKLYLTTMKGELVVVNSNPERYEELSRATILESTRQAPALSGGQLFLRDDQAVTCVDLQVSAK